MTRRYLLTRLRGKPTDPAPPTDEHALNHFVNAYNLYIEQLKRGILDLRQWRKVVDGWKRLTS